MLPTEDAPGCTAQGRLHDYPYCAPAVVEAKVRYLTARFPSLLMQRDAHGFTPLHCTCGHVDDPSDDENCVFSCAVVRLLCEAGGRKLVQMKVQSRPGRNSSQGSLALHIFMSNDSLALDSPVSDLADCFRLLLRLYPEVTARGWGKLGLYGGGHTDRYFRRLLYRTAPVLPPRLVDPFRDGNWKPRKMAMFLAYKARTANVEPTVFSRLRFEDQTLLRHVVSFL